MNLCRSCNTQKTNLLNLFINDFDEDDEPTLAAKFQTCTSLQVDFGDELPQKICYSCAKALESAYKFVKLCRKSDKEFRSSLAKKKQSKEIGKSESAIVSKTKTDSHNEDEELDADFLDENDETEVFTVVQQKQEQQLRKELDAGTGAGDDDHSNLSAKSQKEFQGNRKFACMYCNKKFLMQKAHQMHVSIFHKEKIKLQDLRKADQMKEEQKSPQSYCAISIKSNDPDVDEKNYSLRQSMYKECSDCMTIFKNEHEFRLHHIKKHKLKCQDCGKFMTTHYSLKKHQKLHNIDDDYKLPYECRQCGKSFAEKKHLDHHKIYHSKAIYRCKENNCDKIFNVKYKLLDHLRRFHNKNLTNYDKKKLIKPEEVI